MDPTTLFPIPVDQNYKVKKCKTFFTFSNVCVFYILLYSQCIRRRTDWLVYVYDRYTVFSLTSKPSEPHRGTFKPDLAVFVNLDILITNLFSFFSVVFSVSLSSTSASKFEFIDCLRGTGVTGCILFEFKFARSTRIYNISAIHYGTHILSGRTCTFKFI